MSSTKLFDSKIFFWKSVSFEIEMHYNNFTSEIEDQSPGFKIIRWLYGCLSLLFFRGLSNE